MTLARRIKGCEKTLEGMSPGKLYEGKQHLMIAIAICIINHDEIIRGKSYQRAITMLREMDFEAMINSVQEVFDHLHLCSRSVPFWAEGRRHV